MSSPSLAKRVCELFSEEGKDWDESLKILLAEGYSEHQAECALQNYYRNGKKKRRTEE